MVNRFLCWDETLIEKSENITVEMHKPEKKNIALMGDYEWAYYRNALQDIRQKNS